MMVLGVILMEQLCYKQTHVLTCAFLKIFQEFMVATKPANEDESEAKLRWAFRMYDTDSSGEWWISDNYECSINVTQWIYISHNIQIHILFSFPSFTLNSKKILVLGCIDEREFSEIISSMYEEQGVSCVSFLIFLFSL